VHYLLSVYSLLPNCSLLHFSPQISTEISLLPPCPFSHSAIPRYLHTPIHPYSGTQQCRPRMLMIAAFVLCFVSFGVGCLLFSLCFLLFAAFLRCHKLSAICYTLFFIENEPPNNCRFFIGRYAICCCRYHKLLAILYSLLIIFLLSSFLFIVLIIRCLQPLP